MLFFIFVIRYDQFFERHGILMASFLFLGICISSAAVPLAYVYFDNSNYNKEKAVQRMSDHYGGIMNYCLTFGDTIDNIVLLANDVSILR